MAMTVFRHAILASALMAAGAQAQGFENIDALEGRLIAALDADIGTPGGPLAPIDRRLKLAPCKEGAAFDPPALGAVAVRCASQGWRIRVPLMREQQASVVKADPVVRRGDAVQLQAGGSFFEVNAQAIAEQDGAEGARIRVRTGPKSAPVMAEVVTVGVVRLPGFKGSR